MDVIDLNWASMLSWIVQCQKLVIYISIYMPQNTIAQFQSLRLLSVSFIVRLQEKQQVQCTNLTKSLYFQIYNFPGIHYLTHVFFYQKEKYPMFGLILLAISTPCCIFISKADHIKMTDFSIFIYYTYISVPSGSFGRSASLPTNVFSFGFQGRCHHLLSDTHFVCT